ncbi:MAG: AAA family ATPase [Prevotella sp.]|nr:AAA family ATPase [Prevotella sp.]
MRKIKTLPLSNIYNNADNNTENENSVSLPENGDTNEGVSDNDKDFDELLDDFIKSQLEDNEENTENSCRSVQEEPYEPYADDDNAEENGDEVEECSSDDDEETNEDDYYDCDFPEEEEDDEPEVEELTLDKMIGLGSVKEKLVTYEHLVRFNKLRHDSGLPTPSIPLHAMFLGAPGTGKTTVAKMMGKMLADTGVLSYGHVVVKERSKLIGQFYSNEEKNTLRAIEDAQGGILFIDEAYQLYQPHDPKDPGKFVIETLMTALADESKRDWMLILAGYPDEMRKMFEMNPGLKSRIPDSNIYVFDDYTAGELMCIAENYLERNQYTLTAEAREALTLRLRSDYEQRDKSFGNARHVVNMIETDILPAMAARVVLSGDCDVKALTEIHACDIPKPIRKLQAVRQRIGFCA